jgi:heme/copper-type cytochrome/quinol oxidase subunit 4
MKREFLFTSERLDHERRMRNRWFAVLVVLIFLAGMLAGYLWR